MIQQLFHLNNNVRLLALANKPITFFEYRNRKITLPKITDVKDKQFSKTIEETTKIY